MTWTNIPNANLGVGSPIRSIDLLAIRDNISALANGDTGSPKIQNAAYNAGSITPDKLNGNQTGPAPALVARAWATFNGTGTVAIIASANVSSITDLGTGNYRVNFTNAMINADYSCVSSSNGVARSVGYVSGTTTGATLITGNSATGGAVDVTPICMGILS